MVTVQQYASQLRQRGQTLASAESEVRKFEPAIRQSQRQLRSATPESQVKVKSEEAQRGEAKQEALQKVEIEKGKQEQFQAKFAPIKAKFVEQQSIRKDWDKAMKAAASSDARAVFGLTTDRQREFFRDIQKGLTGSQATQGTTALEEELQMSLPEDVRHSSPEEYRAKMNFAQGGDSVSLASPEDLSKGVIPLGVSVMSMPTIGQKIRRKIKQATGISIPAFGSLKDYDDPSKVPESQGGPRTLAGTFHPANIPGAVTGFSEYAPKKAGEIAQFGAERAGLQDFDVDVGTVPIARHETITFESPKSGEVGLGTATNIYSDPQIITMGAKEVGKTVETATKFGQFAIPVYGSVLAGAYGLEGVKQATVKVPTVQQVILDQTTDLTVTERQAYLATPEGKEYKGNVDEYVKSLKSQRTAGIIQAGLAFGGLGLAGGIRGARFLRKPVVRQIVKPSQVVLEGRTIGFKIGDKVTGLKVGGIKTTEEVITIQSKGAELLGLKPRIYGVQPAKLDVTKQVFVIKGDKAGSVGFEKTAGKSRTLKKWFQTEEVTAPIKVAQKKGAVNRVLDTSKLPKNVAYVAKKQPVRAGSKIETFVSAGREYKGYGPTTQPVVVRGKPYWMHKKPKIIDKVKNILKKEELGPGFAVPKKAEASRKLMQDTYVFAPKRTIRTSKTQKQQFIPTRKPTLKEAPATISISTVEPISKVGSMRTYVTDTATKLTKSAKPRAAGKVTQERTRVAIIDLPKKEIGKYSLKKGDSSVFKAKKKQTQAQILKEQKQESKLVARIESVTKSPKPKPLVSKASQISKDIEKAYTPSKGAVVAPKLTRGSVSAYYGKGTYEKTSEVSAPVSQKQTLVDAPMLQSRVDNVMSPLGVGTQDRDTILIKDKGLGKEREDVFVKEQEKEVLSEGLVPGLVEGTKIRQPQLDKIRASEALVPAYGVKTKQVQKPKLISRPARPQRPGGTRPKPKVPTKPFIPIIPPTKKVKKIKLKKKGAEELVTPFVKRRGKFFAISKPTTKAKAIKKGVAKLRGTLAASLQLRKGGEAIPFAKESKSFRVGKAGAKTLVQRQRARLGRAGETRELIRSRGGAKFFK